MKRLRTVLGTFTAVFSLMALLLAAFEHEDLILQSTGDAAPAAPESRPSGPLPTEPMQLGDTRSESGTEGTFRSESPDPPNRREALPLAPTFRRDPPSVVARHFPGRIPIEPVVSRILGVVELRV